MAYRRRWIRLGCVLLVLAAIPWRTAPASAALTELHGPPGSGRFGSAVAVLPNGNLVVADPAYDAPGPIVDVGAVYLYDGETHALISTLTGSTAGDAVGSDVFVLTNGNYVIGSADWHNGAVAQAGAWTWGDATSGVAGVVSSANSLVGSSKYGVSSKVMVLPNGNYLVLNSSWSNDDVQNAGAVTWGDGASGTVGVVSSANSLVGSTEGDQLGYNSRVTVLPNGNYIVSSPYWDSGAVVDAGAVTWADGSTGLVGPVSLANSLVGSTANDNVGDNRPKLANGNYIVSSPYWDSGAVVDAGAVTWADGSTGLVGPVSLANSLVGTTAKDYVGLNINILANGNYVASTPYWNNGALVDAGAVTWADGTSGMSGAVSSTNSLVGVAADERVGDGGVIALANGNYVVRSPYWRNGSSIQAGAVTWGDGTTGVAGPISPANSLVGTAYGEGVGHGGVIPLSNGNYVIGTVGWIYGSDPAGTASTWADGTTGIIGTISSTNSLIGGGHSFPLSNGNYVVVSSEWDNGTVTSVGAVTLGNGASGTVGVVSAANSLIGSTAEDRIGSDGVLALTNGNYVVYSKFWDNGAVINAGAITWSSGITGTVGVVSAANSLVGSTEGDLISTPYGPIVGFTRNIFALPNGNYLVCSSSWDNGAVVNAGAITWGDGNGGTVGAISPANSLVGSTANDLVWANVSNPYDSGTTNPVRILPNGNYVINSAFWDNGTVVDAGAVTWGDGTGGTVGAVSAANSLVGSTANDWVGLNNTLVLPNGTYVVTSSTWDNGTLENTGATVWAYGKRGVVGPITSSNSIRGLAVNKGLMIVRYDTVNAQLIVGHPGENKLVFWGSLGYRTYLPHLGR